MGNLVIEILYLLAGFFLLGKGADGLVEGGAALANRWGVSPLMVGLTVVAWGTSMPELVVSSLAAYEGNPEMSLGNVLGSNVANIGLVMGCSALILPAVLTGRPAMREIFWLLGSLALLWFVCSDRAVERWEAGLLLAVFAIYNIVLLTSFRRSARTGLESAHGQEELAMEGPKSPMLYVVLGSIAIAAGAKFVMTGGGALAVRAGMTELEIALTVFAVGTSLPELAAGVKSAMKGHSDISFGNVMGSNVFNTMAVIGVAGLIAPFDAAEPKVSKGLGVALERDFPVTLAFSIALAVLPFMLRRRLGRVKGGILLTAYVVYMVLLFVLGTS